MDTTYRLTNTNKTNTPDAERWQRAATTSGWLVLSAMASVTLLAPLALSFHSLADWGREAIGLTGWWPYVVPLALDATAVAYVALTFLASIKGESAGAARVLVWVCAAASAAGNWRHGSTISTDAAVFSAAMPVSAAVLLDVVLRRLRRTVLGHMGAIEPPLPRYRFARWIVAPLSTWRGWTTAVVDGVTDPQQALALSRARRNGAGPQSPSTGMELPAGPHGPAVPSTTLLEGHSDDSVPSDLVQWRKKDAICLAFDRMGRIHGGDAHRWLAERGISVNRNYCDDVARRLTRWLTATAEREPTDQAPEADPQSRRRLRRPEHPLAALPQTA